MWRSRSYVQLFALPMRSSSRLRSMQETFRDRSRTCSTGQSETTKPAPCMGSRWRGSTAPSVVPLMLMLRFGGCSDTSERGSLKRRVFTFPWEGMPSARMARSLPLTFADRWPMPSHNWPEPPDSGTSDPTVWDSPDCLSSARATLGACAPFGGSSERHLSGWGRRYLLPIVSWRKSGRLTGRRSSPWRPSSRCRHLPVIPKIHSVFGARWTRLDGHSRHTDPATGDSGNATVCPQVRGGLD